MLSKLNTRGLRKIISVLPKMLIFELFFKLLTWIVFRPLLRFIIQSMLRISGYQLAFNNFITGFLFTVPGIISAVLLLVLSAAFTYYEFTVLILLAGYRLEGSKVSIWAVLRKALTDIKNLKHVSSIGFCIYVFVLLPIVNMGLTSSLLPQFSIPNFITGELAKNAWGPYVLALAAVLIFLLFLSMLFVLPVMVLEQKNFGKAVSVGFQLIRRKGWKVLLAYGTFFIAWGILFGGPRQLITHIFGTPDVGITQIFRVFGYSWKAIILMIAVGVIKLIQLILTPLMTAVLVSKYRDVREKGKMLPAAEKTEEIPFERNMRNVLKKKLYLRIMQWGAGILLGGALLIGVVRILSDPPGLHEPIVISHRGSIYGVENTLEAIQGAVDAGADYTEVDVLLSSDGVPVVIHDSNLKRLTGEDVNVYELTAEELTSMEVNQNGYTGKIPTLDQVVQYCKGNIGLAIELKVHGQEDGSLVDPIMDVLNRYRFSEECIFISLEYTLIEELKENYPECTAGYCVFGNVGDLNYKTLMDMMIDFVVIEESMASSSSVYDFRGAWLPVYVWTVNDQADMKRYLEMGIIGVVTDYPDAAGEAVQQYSRESDAVYLDEKEWKD